MWIDVEAGVIETAGKSFHFAPYPKSLKQILDAGGLIPYVAKYVLPHQAAQR
jgi:3-isopropylmalate/(R)-2-methylmalate dehydratase small subunit